MLMIAAELESVDGLGYVVIEKFLDPDILREVRLAFCVLRCFCGVAERRSLLCGGAPAFISVRR
jgi:hypothetical protein